MFSRTVAAAINGICAAKVLVEADVSEGMPMFSMIGYLAGEVREAQDRVRTALKNIGYALPVKRITVHLSPADLRKSGSGFDLPIAVAVLCAMGVIPASCVEGILFAGELSLDGGLEGIRGVLEMVSSAASFGCHTCIVPQHNLAEGSVFSGMRVLGAANLLEVIAYLKEGKPLHTMSINIEEIRSAQRRRMLPDFAQVSGQAGLKRAAQIAVAGFHNLLLLGPPGAGKTMAAKCIPSILPGMSDEEVLEVSRIHSIAGTLPPGEGILTVRPFRAIHHTATPVSLSGGGHRAVPGEISLAHRGVLFLDELPEFSTQTLEILRQPLEDGQIVISRNTGTVAFPARFMLVAAMNPCKCGYYPDRNRCRCTPRDVRRYLSKISQPLLDRMDICVEVAEPEYASLSNPKPGESSRQMEERVIRAKERQKERYQNTPYENNAQLPPQAVRTYCTLEPSAERLMERAYKAMQLTGRSYMKILKVARTIADFDGADRIGETHLSEAIGYRMLDRKLWGGE